MFAAHKRAVYEPQSRRWHIITGRIANVGILIVLIITGRSANVGVLIVPFTFELARLSGG